MFEFPMKSHSLPLNPVASFRCIIFFPIETLEPPLFHPGHLEDPFHCFELLLSHQRLPSSFLHALAAWSRKNAKRETKNTARPLCALESLDVNMAILMGAIWVL